MKMVSFKTMLIREDNAVYTYNVVADKIAFYEDRIKECEAKINECPEFKLLYERDIKQHAVKLLGLKMDLSAAEHDLKDARAELRDYFKDLYSPA